MGLIIYKEGFSAIWDWDNWSQTTKLQFKKKKVINKNKTNTQQHYIIYA